MRRADACTRRGWAHTKERAHLAYRALQRQRTLQCAKRYLPHSSLGGPADSVIKVVGYWLRLCRLAKILFHRVP
ncbi:MAG: hypothetical protein JWO42_4078 [Chloroflexi bacterium]|nr:hypothetical protein [Chloroflexota bacterium]